MQSGRLVLAAPVTLDPAQKYLMRGDRVDFPVGGVAYLHRHQGPGTRRLLHGSIRIETQGKTHEVAPGRGLVRDRPGSRVRRDFDHGRERVRARHGAAAGAQGQKLDQLRHDADKDKPKTQRYQVFIDFPISV
ncbi:MAG: hypothetical protein WDO24_06180 [Pseudomonadota bacterium]